MAHKDLLVRFRVGIAAIRYAAHSKGRLKGRVGTCDYVTLLGLSTFLPSAREHGDADGPDGRPEIEIHGYVAARIYSIYIVHDLLKALRERARGPRGGRRRAALRRVLPVVAP